MTPKSQTFAIVALISGILSFVLGWTAFFGLVLGVVAVIFGILALQRKQPKGLSLTGLILGGIGALTSLIVGIVLVVGIGVIGAIESEASSTQAETTEVPQEEPEEESAAPAADVVYSGTGDSILEITLPAGPDSIGIATLTHSGSRNFAVWSLDQNLNQDDLLVNTIGNYSGTVVFNLSTSTRITAFEISADGAWTVTLRDVQTVRTLEEGSAATGQGDDVLVYFGDTSIATLEHSGTQNFAIWSYSDTAGDDLLVNEIGSYSGEVRWPSGPALIDISADGPWSIAVN